MKDKVPKLFNTKADYLNELSRIYEKAEGLSYNSFVNRVLKCKDFAERLEHAHQLDKNEVKLPIELGEVSEDVEALIKAATILELLGMEGTSREVKKHLYAVGQYKVIQNDMMNYIVYDEAKSILSDKNSENASGPRNEYHDEAIKIMMDTWSEYPLASKNRMKAKIIEYFGKDRSGKDKVSDSSIKRWIKLNNLGPEKEVRPPVDFHLVIRP